MPGWISYSFFMGVALKSVTVLGAAWLVTFLLRRRSAAVRHALWTAAFAALLALPFLSMALPILSVPIKGPLTAGLVFQTDVSAAYQRHAPRTGDQAMTASPLKSEPSLPDLSQFLMLLWAAGATVSFAQMFTGWVAMQRLRRRASPFSEPDLVSLAKLFEIDQEVNLLETPQGSMPATYGLLRPAIFMPVDSAEWSVDRRRVVLLHELAHVRRRDSAMQLLARTALSLYWWNPLAWFAWREFLKERERAADDMVLNAGACASEYASHLLEIARSMHSTAALEYAAVAMARRSQLEGRLLAILDSSRQRKNPRRALSVLASLLAVPIIAPLAAVQAQSDQQQAPASDRVSVSSVAGLIQQGDTALEQGNFNPAKTLYQRALTALGSGPERAKALLHLGVAELATKNIEEAIVDFEKAQEADSAKTGEARMWMAIARQRQNDLPAASGLYQSALAAQDPNSAATATILELYGQLLSQQGQYEQAKMITDQAAAIRKAQAAQMLATSQPSSPDVYQIGGDVKAPTLIFKVEPEYSQEARLAKYQGSILLSVEINVAGNAQNIKVIRGLGLGLDEKAIDAVRRWRFQPGTKFGEPVTTAAKIEVNFRLF